MGGVGGKGVGAGDFGAWGGKGPVCICPICLKYLSKFFNAFVQIMKSICAKEWTIEDEQKKQGGGWYLSGLYLSNS